MRISPFPALCLMLALAGSALMTALPGRATGPTAGEAHAPAPKIALPLGKTLPGPFAAEVLDIIDGDTLEARVTVWIGQTIETRVRLRGIDAAEMSSECAEERALATVSRAALRRFTATDRIYLTDVSRDKYGGRVVATVLSGTGDSIGAMMLREGFAIAYDGGRRQPWCGTAPTFTARR